MARSYNERVKGEPTHRQLRVGEEVRHALSQAFSHGETLSESLSGVSITVSQVVMSSDLRVAFVYVSPLLTTDDGLPITTIVQLLNEEASHLRGRITKRLKLKFMPSLRFRGDESFEHAQRVTDLVSGRI